VALVLQGGWAGRHIGIDAETPLPAFVPVLMFAVLFGLSKDYEVLLVSRIRESHAEPPYSVRCFPTGAHTCRDQPSELSRPWPLGQGKSGRRSGVPSTSVATV
jgi:hypothetical protein